MVKVPIVRPDLGAAEAEAAARVVRSGWIMQGPEVAAFEHELAAYVGAPHAVAVSNGTVALELALRVLGVGPGDEVITVSHSFIASANCVVTVGATPVFVDVEPDTFSMDPRRIAAARSPRTKAVLCVHQLGFPCDLAAIAAAAGELPILEDAACAIGTEAELDGRWERIGRPRGRIACFSFHPRKVVTTGEGGMLTTADAALADRLRLLRNHAMTLPPEIRDKDPLARERFVEPGTNARLTDLQAAIGRSQLARLPATIAERRRLAAAYTAALVDHPVLAPPTERPAARSNIQSYPTQLRPGSKLDQRGVLELLLARGIAGRRGIANAHQEPAYAGRGNHRISGSLEVSERLRDRVVMLPLFNGMTAEEEAAVLDALAELRKA
jgi:dTDP-4-amino-4,6-dideoxygalactose transaminase